MKPSGAQPNMVYKEPPVNPPQAAVAASAGSAVTVVVFPAAMAVLLGALGRQLVRRRSWARGPAIALQLLLLPLGYSMVTGGAAWLGVPAMVAGLACTGLLVAPASREALGIR